jgi:[acyl-carrier-protein] S-malonyltransferase
MGEKLAERYAYVREFVDEASRRTGLDLPGVFFGKGSASLSDDLPAQVGVFVVSVSVLDVLDREFGLRPEAVAGYSLGTYAAFVAAGAVDRWDALSVVVELERLLREERPEGGLGFVIGLSAEKVESELRKIGPPSEIAIGNRNAPNQVVLTGSDSALDESLKALAPIALRSGRLAVRWPMHSVRMRPVTSRLQEFVDRNVLVRPPGRARLFAPMLGREVTMARDASLVLGSQASHLSNWEEAVRATAAAGYSSFVEAGPGDVLARMLRWIVREARVTVLEDPDSISRFSSKEKN